jgi:hypothetical protein
MPYAYEFVKSVESVAAFEGAKQLPATTGTNFLPIRVIRGCLKKIDNWQRPA